MLFEFAGQFQSLMVEGPARLTGFSLLVNDCVDGIADWELRRAGAEKPLMTGHLRLANSGPRIDMLTGDGYAQVQFGSPIDGGVILDAGERATLNVNMKLTSGQPFTNGSINLYMSEQ
jgi:hypothetical protein